jgi:hypothetical protein
MSLSVATTGSISLAATATGYTRAAATGTVTATAGAATFSVSQAGKIANGGKIKVGSSTYTISGFDGTTGATLSGSPTFGATAFTVGFDVDGLEKGMEIAPTGFTQTATGIVTNVSALTMSIKGGRTTQAAGTGRTLTAGLPASRHWENVAFTPVDGVPYVVEQYTPGPQKQITVGDFGYLEFLPLYSPQIHVPQGTGPEAADAYADALLTLFAPGTTIPLENAESLRVRRDVAPTSGQLLQSSPGFAAVPVDVPLRLTVQNVI